MITRFIRQQNNRNHIAIEKGNRTLNYVGRQRQCRNRIFMFTFQEDRDILPAFPKLTTNSTGPL